MSVEITITAGVSNMLELNTGTTNAITTTTGDMYERFVSFLDASPRTIDTYKKALKQWHNYTTVKHIETPTRDDVVSFRDELKATHRAGTVQLYMTVVKLFFRWTAQEGLYPNVADHVKGAKVTAGFKKDYLTSGQIKNVLGSIERDDVRGLRDYAVFALAVTAGLRTVEVIRANIEDLRTLGDSRVLYVQGKGRGDKTELVKVAGAVDDAIAAYLKAAGTPKEGQPLFRSDANRNRGGRLTTRSVSRIVKERLISAGYDSDRLTAHSLRHSAATLNLLNGGSLVETQQLLRHKNINTTMVYSHALTRAGNNSEERIAGTIFAA
jgi:integrase/recombinase XerC